MIDMRGEIKEVFETATVMIKMRYIFFIILIAQCSDVFIHWRLEYEWVRVGHLVLVQEGSRCSQPPRIWVWCLVFRVSLFYTYSFMYIYLLAPFWTFLQCFTLNLRTYQSYLNSFITKRLLQNEHEWTFLLLHNA